MEEWNGKDIHKATLALAVGSPCLTHTAQSTKFSLHVQTVKQGYYSWLAEKQETEFLLKDSNMQYEWEIWKNKKQTKIGHTESAPSAAP